MALSATITPRSPRRVVNGATANSAQPSQLRTVSTPGTVSFRGDPQDLPVVPWPGPGCVRSSSRGTAMCRTISLTATSVCLMDWS